MVLLLSRVDSRVLKAVRQWFNCWAEADRGTPTLNTEPGITGVNATAGLLRDENFLQ
jgi:hypothetical protein